ncbi:hypothetical protein ALI144C_42615 [Actinosynnema sp. ALI-1.44]|nr:hypothetical protein ALI144C_42615 [Actinosynnema sp. ALI-1.44]
MATTDSSNEIVYYRPAEVASILRCSEWWVKEQARNRRIPFSWIGGGYLFTTEHIVEIVALFERRPTTGRAATSRTHSPRQSTDTVNGNPLAQLVARPPRRARDDVSND